MPTGQIKIAEHYGLLRQSEQLIEEMAELTQAICKRKRLMSDVNASEEDLKENEENIIEEIADVKNVLEQVMYLLECEDDVYSVKIQKIKRQLERIEKYESNN